MQPQPSSGSTMQPVTAVLFLSDIISPPVGIIYPVTFTLFIIGNYASHYLSFLIIGNYASLYLILKLFNHSSLELCILLPYPFYYIVGNYASRLHYCQVLCNLLFIIRYFVTAPIVPFSDIMRPVICSWVLFRLCISYHY
jgi:hypothetical protein